MIYLDNAATTYPKPETVYKALDLANREFAFNAGRGTYKQSYKVQEIIAETRKLLSSLADASDNQVVFLSSATEALNLIINGLDFHEGDNIYITPFEHNAIVRPLYEIKKLRNINIHIIPFIKETWELNYESLNNQFALKKPKAVFVSHISNVTGYILPYEKIFQLSKKYEAINVLDSAQSLGVLNPDKEVQVDFIVFAGHKSLYATFGVAGFINKGNINLKITKSGGTGSDSLNHYMPENGNSRYEAGSLNSVAIYGLRESIKWLNNNDIYEHERKLTDYAINKLSLLEKIDIYLPIDRKKILGIISFNILGFSSDNICKILNDEFNICVRNGYHCSPFVHEFIDTINKEGTVRISLGAFNTKEEIDKLIEALKTL